jgi:transcriptional regulator with XRE-family HTH domain
METKDSIRKVLGVTQEEVAMLLRVTKSQLAMYETGQRDLPIKAKLKLVAMWQYVHNKQEIPLPLPDTKVIQAKITKIEKQLAINEHKQILLERKLDRHKSRYEKSLSTLKLVEFIETQLPEEEKPDKELVALIYQKALQGIEKNGLSVQKKCAIEKNRLQQYQKELRTDADQYRIHLVS